MSVAVAGRFTIAVGHVQSDVHGSIVLDGFRFNISQARRGARDGVVV